MPLQEGRYSSIRINQDHLYAAESREKEMHIFNSYGPTWRFARKFKLGYHASEHPITIGVKGGLIACCSYGFNDFKVFSLDGQLKKQYSTRNMMMTTAVVCPLLCANDSDGCVLISDEASNRIQVMSEQGGCKSLTLKPQMVKPCAATLFFDNLYVASVDKVLRKYSATA